MQDPSAVEVLEARYDLSEVISNLRFGERVSGFPDVCQALWRRSNERTVSPRLSGGENTAAQHKIRCCRLSGGCLGLSVMTRLDSLDGLMCDCAKTQIKLF